jgi:hypothetical protein
MYILNNTSERPDSCITPLFMCIGSDIPWTKTEYQNKHYNINQIEEGT